MKKNQNIKRAKLNGSKCFYYFVSGVSVAGIKRHGDFALKQIEGWSECSVSAICLDGRFYTVGKKGGFKTIYEAICAKSRKPMVDKKRVKRESQDLVDFLYAMSLWPVGSLAGTVR